MDSLEFRLQRLEDIEAIKNLISRYAWHAACGESEQLSALFAADGEMNSGGQIMRGRTALIGYFKMLQPSHTIPHVQNFIIEVNGDSAFSRCSMITPWIGAFAGTCGWYEDHLRREDGAWRFINRKWTRHQQPS